MKSQDLRSIASSVDGTKTWFNTNVQPCKSDTLQYSSVGNEVVPGGLNMQNLQTIVSDYKCTGVRVSRVVTTGTLGSSNPPSSDAFSDEAGADMDGNKNLLSNTSSPLLINVSPYFAHAANPLNWRFDYAQFTVLNPAVQDGNLGYLNMLDTIVDAF